MVISTWKMWKKQAEAEWRSVSVSPGAFFTVGKRIFLPVYISKRMRKYIELLQYCLLKKICDKRITLMIPQCMFYFVEVFDLIFKYRICYFVCPCHKLSGLHDIYFEKWAKLHIAEEHTHHKNLHRQLLHKLGIKSVRTRWDVKLFFLPPSKFISG